MRRLRKGLEKGNRGLSVKEKEKEQRMRERERENKEG